MQGLAERCVPETTASQINKLEKGAVKLTVNWLTRLAAALQCDVVDLLVAQNHDLSPAERVLLSRFRDLPATDQAKVNRVIDAFAVPEASTQSGGATARRPFRKRA